MKDLSDYVVFQDGKFWIDTEDQDTGDVPFEVGVPFTFTNVEDPVERCILSGVGVVDCDDGVDEVAMIPFRVIE
jgi:hypothetical protein